MKEHPILFSTPMVQSIIELLKSMTRRTKGLEKINENPDDWQFEWAEPLRNLWTFTQLSTVNEESIKNRNFNQEQLKCPYGQPGDILWVRETWIDTFIPHTTPVGGLYFKADHPEENSLRWKPSIHMPKYAARIWLKITSIKVERLNSISAEDALKEGMKNQNIPFSPVYQFFNLWEKLNGEESLNANPWVWVIEFEILSTTGKPAGL